MWDLSSRSLQLYNSSRVVDEVKLQRMPAAHAIRLICWLRPSIKGILAVTKRSESSLFISAPIEPIFSCLCMDFSTHLSDIHSQTSLSLSCQSPLSLLLHRYSPLSPVLSNIPLPNFTLFDWCDWNWTYLFVCVGFWYTVLFNSLFSLLEHLQPWTVKCAQSPPPS